MKKQTLKRPPRITFQDKTDLETCVRGSLGHHTKAIAKATKLSEGQVNYRLTKAGISRREYRDGKSFTAKYVLRQATESLTNHWFDELTPRFKYPKGSKHEL